MIVIVYPKRITRNKYGLQIVYFSNRSFYGVYVILFIVSLIIDKVNYLIKDLGEYDEEEEIKKTTVTIVGKKYEEEFYQLSGFSEKKLKLQSKIAIKELLISRFDLDEKLYNLG